MGTCSSSTPEGGARKPSTIPVVVQENTHGRFSDISGVEKSTGVYRTSPLLDAMADEDLEVTELSALKQIQKSVRRTRALKKAKNDAHWTFFAQVDTLEENETLTMASFLQNQSLVSLLPLFLLLFRDEEQVVEEKPRRRQALASRSTRRTNPPSPAEPS